MFQYTDLVSGELLDVFQSRYRAYDMEEVRVKMGVVKERKSLRKTSQVDRLE